MTRKAFSLLFGAFILFCLHPFPVHAGHDEHDEHGHEEGNGRIELAEATIEAGGLQLKAAGKQRIAEHLTLNGKLLPNEHRTAHLVPRFSGVIREAYKLVGDPVKKGDILAVIESNQSLQPYELRSPLDGTVIRRHASAGEFAAEAKDLFVVTDLSSLWADFYLFPADFGKVKKGQQVLIRLEHRTEPVYSSITMVSSVVDEATQSKVVRAEINKAEEHLYPGQFVTGQILLSETDVPVAVESSAVQRIGGKTAVFVPHEDEIERREVIIGRQNGRFSEIVSGLHAGEQYYSGNTFILKAEFEKSKAVHEH